ncbi:hypothetical protein FRC04_009509 [Tulasnella sp. 424]|nr:hypothetical protein FRC04_009509 [Tulasnella sp. 424]KAG8971227.1 hypothetical protein FRC05_011422 [Tulasnella sp. 425]
MDFTEIYKQTSGLVAFSPGAQFVLTAVEDRLIVRRADSFQIARTWLVDTSPSATHSILSFSSKSTKPASSNAGSDGWISHISWSRDSEYMLAACAKRGVIGVFKMRDEDWEARIETGAEGLVRAEWAPDGRSIMCFSGWGLRVTIWSLITGLATYIQYPKHPDRGYAFRKDGRYLLLAERHKSKDTMGVYDTVDEYKLVRHFPLPTSSLSSIAISPTGSHVAVWEGPLDYKLHIITLVGNVVATFTPPEPDTALGLGIRAVVWHPTGAFLAVGGWDDKIHIVTSHGWMAIMTFELSAKVPANVFVWREPERWLEATHGKGFLSYDRVHAYQSSPVPLIRVDATKPHPKSGLVQLEWNLDGTLLMARFEQAPTAIHVYSFPKPDGEPFAPRLSTVLLHSKSVLQARWNPTQTGLLAACCGTGAVFTWDVGNVAECVGVPAKQFEVRDIRWAPDGRGMALVDKEAFCCAFMVIEDEDEYLDEAR